MNKRRLLLLSVFALLQITTSDRNLINGRLGCFNHSPRYLSTDTSLFTYEEHRVQQFSPEIRQLNNLKKDPYSNIRETETKLEKRRYRENIESSRCDEIYNDIGIRRNKILIDFTKNIRRRQTFKEDTFERSNVQQKGFRHTRISGVRDGEFGRYIRIAPLSRIDNRLIDLSPNRLRNKTINRNLSKQRLVKRNNIENNAIDRNNRREYRDINEYLSENETLRKIRRNNVRREYRINCNIYNRRVLVPATETSLIDNREKDASYNSEVNGIKNRSQMLKLELRDKSGKQKDPAEKTHAKVIIIQSDDNENIDAVHRNRERLFRIINKRSSPVNIYDSRVIPNVARNETDKSTGSYNARYISLIIERRMTIKPNKIRDINRLQFDLPEIRRDRTSKNRVTASNRSENFDRHAEYRNRDTRHPNRQSSSVEMYDSRDVINNARTQFDRRNDYAYRKHKDTSEREISKNRDNRLTIRSNRIQDMFGVERNLAKANERLSQIHSERRQDFDRYDANRDRDRRIPNVRSSSVEMYESRDVGNNARAHFDRRNDYVNRRHNKDMSEREITENRDNRLTIRSNENRDIFSVERNSAKRNVRLARIHSERREVYDRYGENRDRESRLPNRRSSSVEMYESRDVGNNARTHFDRRNENTDRRQNKDTRIREFSDNRDNRLTIRSDENRDIFSVERNLAYRNERLTRIHIERREDYGRYGENHERDSRLPNRRSSSEELYDSRDVRNNARTHFDRRNENTDRRKNKDTRIREFSDNRDNRLTIRSDENRDIFSVERNLANRNERLTRIHIERREDYGRYGENHERDSRLPNRRSSSVELYNSRDVRNNARTQFDRRNDNTDRRQNKDTRIRKFSDNRDNRLTIRSNRIRDMISVESNLDKTNERVSQIHSERRQDFDKYDANRDRDRRIPNERSSSVEMYESRDVGNNARAHIDTGNYYINRRHNKDTSEREISENRDNRLIIKSNENRDIFRVERNLSKRNERLSRIHSERREVYDRYGENRDRDSRLLNRRCSSVEIHDSRDVGNNARIHFDWKNDYADRKYNKDTNEREISENKENRLTIRSNRILDMSRVVKNLAESKERTVRMQIIRDVFSRKHERDSTIRNRRGLPEEMYDSENIRNNARTQLARKSINNIRDTNEGENSEDRFRQITNISNRSREMCMLRGDLAEGKYVRIGEIQIARLQNVNVLSGNNKIEKLNRHRRSSSQEMYRSRYYARIVLDTRDINNNDRYNGGTIKREARDSYIESNRDHKFYFRNNMQICQKKLVIWHASKRTEVNRYSTYNNRDIDRENSPGSLRGQVEGVLDIDTKGSQNNLQSNEFGPFQRMSSSIKDASSILRPAHEELRFTFDILGKDDSLRKIKHMQYFSFTKYRVVRKRKERILSCDGHKIHLGNTQHKLRNQVRFMMTIRQHNKDTPRSHKNIIQNSKTNINVSHRQLRSTGINNQLLSNRQYTKKENNERRQTKTAEDARSTNMRCNTLMVENRSSARAGCSDNRSKHENRLLKIKWDHLFYAVQLIYICGILLKLPKQNEKNKHRIAEWFTPAGYLKID